MVNCGLKVTFTHHFNCCFYSFFCIALSWIIFHFIFHYPFSVK